MSFPAYDLVLGTPAGVRDGASGWRPSDSGPHACGFARKLNRNVPKHPHRKPQKTRAPAPAREDAQATEPPRGDQRGQRRERERTSSARDASHELCTRADSHRRSAMRHCDAMGHGDEGQGDSAEATERIGHEYHGDRDVGGEERRRTGGGEAGPYPTEVGLGGRGSGGARSRCARGESVPRPHVFFAWFFVFFGSCFCFRSSWFACLVGRSGRSGPSVCRFIFVGFGLRCRVGAVLGLIELVFFFFVIFSDGLSENVPYWVRKLSLCFSTVIVAGPDGASLPLDRVSIVYWWRWSSGSY